MARNIAVYSVDFNSNDQIKDPEFVDSDIDYHLITNRSHDLSVWKQHFVDDLPFSMRKSARFYKIMGHPSLLSYDYLIWNDASLTIKSSLLPMVNFLKGDYGFFNHRHRSCIYDEAKACLQLGKGNRKKIIQQISLYLKEGMPKNFGLFETGGYIRKQNLTFWWDQIFTHSVRDQISLMYVLWRENIDPFVYDGSVTNNQFWFCTPHPQPKIF